jgi:cyclopropane fatty-acyl-phospholipid synthase-like methyltransferase
MAQAKTSALTARQKEYARLRAQLAHVGWISEGYVQDRGPGAGGACYPWTRKVKGKTVCVALSKEQYEWLKQAIANWRIVQETLRQMQRLSRGNSSKRCRGPSDARNSAKPFSD